MSSTYDTAQICLSGHMVTDRMQSRPESAKKFCSQCGATTISSCSYCKQPIQGALVSRRMVGGSRYLRQPPRTQMTIAEGSVSAFCYGCGRSYPWTQARIDAAKAMADELDGLTDAERLLLKASIDDIAADTPMTEVAVVRVKKLIPKVLASGGEILRKLIVDIASEAAAKSLKGP